MEPLEKTSNVTRLPGAEDVRLREPPHNFEAEQALLGAILVNNAAYQRVAEFLRPEHFADPLHGKLFDSLSQLIERGQVVSAVTLKTYVEHDEDMKTVGGAAYLAQLAAASVHVIDAGAFGRAIHDLYLRRQLIDLGEGVVNGAFAGDVDETALQQIEVAEKKLYDLATTGQTEGGFKPFRIALTEAMVAAEAAYHRAGQLTGVATGLFQLDQLLGGLHRSDLIILAAPPVDGQDRARHQHRLQRRQGLSRGASTTARPRWSTAPWSASSRWKCRPSSSPPACSPSRPSCRRRRSARAS